MVRSETGPGRGHRPSIRHQQFPTLLPSDSLATHAPSGVPPRSLFHLADSLSGHRSHLDLFRFAQRAEEDEAHAAGPNRDVMARCRHPHSEENAKQLRKGDERAATNDAGGGLLMGAFFWALAICVVVDNSARNDSKDGDQLKLV